MADIDYNSFFSAAFKDAREPYGWQCRLAEDPKCQSRLIDIPTGLGKTAGVVLAWLWNRKTESRFSNPLPPDNNPAMENPPPGTWPRRLIYCLQQFS